MKIPPRLLPLYILVATLAALTFWRRFPDYVRAVLRQYSRWRDRAFVLSLGSLVFLAIPFASPVLGPALGWREWRRSRRDTTLAP